MTTQSNFLTSSGLTMVQPVTKALSKILLNIDRLGARTKSLQSLFHCLTTPSVKKCFVVPHWTSSSAVFNHSHTVTGSQRQELSTSLSTFPQEAGESNEVIPQPPFLWTGQTRSPQQLLTGHSLLCFVALLQTHSKTFTPFLNCGARSAHSAPDEATPTLNRAGQSPLHSWSCCVWGTTEWILPFQLSRLTADSSPTANQRLPFPTSQLGKRGVLRQWHLSVFVPLGKEL